MNAPIKSPRTRPGPSGTPSGVKLRARSWWEDAPFLRSYSGGRITERAGKIHKEALAAFTVRSRREERRRSGSKTRRAGEVWKSASEVYGYLVDYTVTCDEVWPSVERVAEAKGLGQSTIHVVKTQLRDIGAIEWVHRARAPDALGPGSPPRQLPNQYRVNELPKRLLDCLPAHRRATYRLELARIKKDRSARAAKARADSAARESTLKAGRSRRPALPPRELIVSGRRAAGQELSPRDSS